MQVMKTINKQPSRSFLYVASPQARRSLRLGFFRRLQISKNQKMVPAAKLIPPYRMGDQIWCARATIGSKFCRRGSNSTLRNIHSSSFPQFINFDCKYALYSVLWSFTTWVSEEANPKFKDN
ncbi:hypothetical protein H5410_018839 [Solanum commersonii]|uniref:Uncharacterized protein n=1 Tax=Solanum commersonii TaxID=4109 RepID=A0A9J6A4J6_SOLCO|nr:hypothetical protein H5410_018839 [Solanum commersonii]